MVPNVANPNMANVPYNSNVPNVPISHNTNVPNIPVVQNRMVPNIPVVQNSNVPHIPFGRNQFIQSQYSSHHASSAPETLKPPNPPNVQLSSGPTNQNLGTLKSPHVLGQNCKQFQKP